MKLGSVVLIEGISGKGKNRIRELGNEWHVLKITDKVMFSDEKAEWILLSPSSNPCKFRWMKKSGDSDFRIVAVRV